MMTHITPTVMMKGFVRGILDVVSYVNIKREVDYVKPSFHSL